MRDKNLEGDTRCVQMQSYERSPGDSGGLGATGRGAPPQRASLHGPLPLGAAVSREGLLVEELLGARDARRVLLGDTERLVGPGRSNAAKPVTLVRPGSDATASR